MFDLAGKKIFQRKVIENNSRFNMRLLPNGFYIYSFTDGKGSSLVSSLLVIINKFFNVFN